MTKWVLLCSASNIDALERMVNAFWYSTQYTINRLTLDIEHPERTPPSTTRIRKLGGRYRFECESPADDE